MSDRYDDFVPTIVERQLSKRLGLSARELRDFAGSLADFLNMGPQPMFSHDIVMGIALFIPKGQQNGTGCNCKSGLCAAASDDEPGSPASSASIPNPA